MSLKRLLKKTVLYRAYRALRQHRDITGWGAADESRRRFYGRLVRPGDLCFDVGANIGNRTKILLRIGCRVVAVEPQPSCLRVLRRYYGAMKDLTIEPIGLGEAPGELTMTIGRESTVSTMAPEWKAAVVRSGRFEEDLWTGQTLTVPVLTLEQLITRHGLPAFIKIDVEGFELPVLRGLRTAPRYLSFEFTPELMPNMLQCIAQCTSIGTPTFNVSLGESMTLVHEQWLDHDAFIQALSRYAGQRDVFGDIYARY